MSTVATNSLASLETPALGRVPPLQSGDHLSRVEFERRYHASPAHLKAELIEGIVYIMAPVTEPGHARPHLRFGTWLGTYEAYTPGTIGGDNGSIRLDLDNMPQPDAYLRIDSDYGGQSKLSDDKYVQGAPDLVAEIAASSASYDLHEKLRVYRRNGVGEYVVWRVWDRAVDWFRLEEGQYVSQKPDNQGIHKSHNFPGLWLDSAALLAGDQRRVLAAVQQGIASPEHANFVAELERRRAARGT